MTELGEFIRAATEARWDWMVHDCSAWPARWAGVDLGVEYHSAEEARIVVKRGGGLVKLYNRRLRKIADRVTGEPEAGDIGVLIAVARDGDGHRFTQVGAIYTGERWAFVPERGGLFFTKSPAVRAWRLRCRKS